MAANLPLEIIVDILSRLCVRDLLRYRCVAKPWCSLIDGPDFIKKHLDHALRTASNLGLVIKDHGLQWAYLDRKGTAEKLDHPLEDDGETDLLGSCNGLLALLDSDYGIALWNPATKRYRKLPFTDIEFPPGFLRVGQCMVYGFGHDPIGDDYKLVRMVQFYGVDEDSFDSEVKVYSAKTNTWKRIRDFPYYIWYKGQSGVFVSNAVHWVVSRKPKSDTSRFVVAFDLATEEYREVPMPDLKYKRFHMNVKALGGSLCVVCNVLNDERPRPDFYRWSLVKHADVWVMKEYGVKESWTKLLSVVPTDETGPFGYILPVGYLTEYGDRWVLLDQNGKKLIVYEVEGKRVVDAGVYSDDHLETIVCMESLVGLDGGEGQNGWKKGVEIKKKKEKKKKKQKQKQKRGKKQQNQNQKSDDFLSQGFKLKL